MTHARPRKTKHLFTVKRGVSGRGLFAKTLIKRKDFAIEYWGPVITDDEADIKGGKYLYDIEGTSFTIDGSVKKNLARYINHSCKPNCEAVTEGKRIYIYALKDIQPGTELTYDYGTEYFNEYIKPFGCKCGHHRKRG